jgi:Protein of unknown function (DUF4019)
MLVDSCHGSGGAFQLLFPLPLLKRVRMTKLIGLLVCVLCLSLTERWVLAAEVPPQNAAQSIAANWLALVDSGKCVEGWEKMSPGFRKEVSKRNWKSAVEKIRKPLGRLTSRKLKSAEYSKELPGAPEGEYVVMQFDSAFEHKPDATEKVILILGQDLNWRVCSYAVK